MLDFSALIDPPVVLTPLPVVKETVAAASKYLDPRVSHLLSHILETERCLHILKEVSARFKLYQFTETIL